MHLNINIQIILNGPLLTVKICPLVIRLSEWRFGCQVLNVMGCYQDSLVDFK